MLLSSEGFFSSFSFVCREEVKEKKERERNRKIKRYALIGLATVGGGTLIGMLCGRLLSLYIFLDHRQLFTE